MVFAMKKFHKKSFGGQKPTVSETASESSGRVKKKSDGLKAKALESPIKSAIIQELKRSI